MKKFNDLKFERHSNRPYFDWQAKIEFDNGYGISVISGQKAYCDKGTFEVAILKNGRIAYDTKLTYDVLGWQTPKDIDRIMRYLQVNKSYPMIRKRFA